MLKFLAISALLITSIMSKATAANYDLFNPKSADTDFMIHYILTPIFGYNQSTSEVNPFSTFSSVFLAGLMMLSAILLCYGWFVSLNDTGQTGSLMGSQHGGRKLTFLTLRTTTGLGLLMPIGNAGISAIQYIVLWISAQGVLLANTAWESFASNPTLGTLTYTSDVKKKAYESATRVFMSEMCYLLGDEVVGSNGQTVSWGKTVKIENASSSQANYSHLDVVNLGIDKKSASYGAGSICGKLAFELPTQSKEIAKDCNISYEEGFGDLALMSSCMSKNTATLDKELKKKHESLLSKWLEPNSIWEKTAQEFLTKQKQVEELQVQYEGKDILDQKKMKEQEILVWLYNIFQTEVNNYAQEISNTTNNFLKENKEVSQGEFHEAMIKYGFAGIGSWYFKLASELSDISRVANQSHAITYVDEMKFECSLGTKFANAIRLSSEADDMQTGACLSKKLVSQLDLVSNYMLTVSYNMDYSPNKNVDSTINEKIAGTVKGVANQMGIKTTLEKTDDTLDNINKVANMVLPLDDIRHKTQTLLSGDKNSLGSIEFANYFRDSSANPILVVKEWGDLLITFSTGAFLGGFLLYMGGTALGLAGFTAGATGGPITAILTGGIMAFIGTLGGGLLTALAVAIQSLSFMLLVPALMMAFYFPLMPFMLWIGSVFGWVVLMVEALFGAPMWVVTFLSPDVDGFVGKLGQGYKLILSIFLRPILMVLGFLVSLHLISPIISFTNFFFLMAIESVWGATNGWFPNLFGYFTMVVLYCIVYNKTTTQIFGLIHKLPDTLLSWIGSQGGQLGQYASGVEGAVGSAAGTAISAAPQIARNISDPMNRAVDNMKQRSIANKEREAQLLKQGMGDNAIIEDAEGKLRSEGLAKNMRDVGGIVGNQATTSSLNNGLSGKEAALAGEKARDEATKDIAEDYGASQVDRGITTLNSSNLTPDEKEKKLNELALETMKEGGINPHTKEKFKSFDEYKGVVRSSNEAGWRYSAQPQEKINPKNTAMPNNLSKVSSNSFADRANAHDYSIGGESYNVDFAENLSKATNDNYQAEAMAVYDNATDEVNRMVGKQEYDAEMVTYARTENGLQMVESYSGKKISNWKAAPNVDHGHREEFVKSMAKNGNNNVVKVFKNAQERQAFEENRLV